MRATFVETSDFTDGLSGQMSDAAYAGLQQLLMDSPNAGEVMTGCGGLRKIRAADPDRGKGKRGGTRVIYLHVPAAKRFYMLDIYGKDEMADLDSNEKKQLRQLADRLKAEAKAACGQWLRENKA